MLAGQLDDVSVSSVLSIDIAVVWFRKTMESSWQALRRVCYLIR